MTRKVLIGSLLLVLAFAMLMLRGDDSAGQKAAVAPRQAGQQEGRYMKPPTEELIKKLTPLQYKVTQEEGTEPAYRNEYWDNKKEGIYVDIVSGEPLFSSLDKYDFGTGWPSFTRPLEQNNAHHHR